MPRRAGSRLALRLVASGMLVCLLGCGSPTIQGGPISYPLDIKRLALAVEVVSKSSPQETPGQVEVLLENLRDAPHEDVGEHGETIEEIAKLAKELESLYNQPAARATTDQKVKELATAARRIPGKVVVREKEME
ncbi:MAG: hypothetical protein WD894_13015 [Pirellulales bacterium]